MKSQRLGGGYPATRTRYARSVRGMPTLRTKFEIKVFVGRLPTLAFRLPSALEDFTAEFGMGSGGALPV